MSRVYGKFNKTSNVYIFMAKNNAKTYKKEMMQSVSCIINQYKSK